MIYVRTEIKGDKKLLKRFLKVERTEEWAHKGALGVADEIMMWAGFFAPKFTGELVKGIKIVEDSGNRIVIESSAPHAAEVEYGSEKGYLPRIRMVDEKMIKWALFKGYGKAIRAGFWKIQKHTPYIRPAIEAVRPTISEKMKNSFEDAWKAGGN